MSEILEILSEKNEKCVVYAVLRDVTGIAGFVYKVFYKSVYALGRIFTGVSRTWESAVV